MPSVISTQSFTLQLQFSYNTDLLYCDLSFQSYIPLLPQHDTWSIVNIIRTEYTVHIIVKSMVSCTKFRCALAFSERPEVVALCRRIHSDA